MNFFITTKECAEKKALAITDDGMHFKGQFLPKENFKIFGKKVELIDKPFKYVFRVKYEDDDYFISEELCEV